MDNTVPGFGSRKWSKFETDFVKENMDRFAYKELSIAILKATGVVRTERAIKQLVLKLRDAWEPGKITKEEVNRRKSIGQQKRRARELREQGFIRPPKDPSVQDARTRPKRVYKKYR